MPGIEAVRIVDADGNDVDIASLLGAGGAGTITSGRKVVSVTNTAVALGSATCKVIFITALIGNTDAVVIGGASVVHTEASRTGKLLYPGDSMTISIDNLGDVFVNGVANDGVSFAYTT